MRWLLTLSVLCLASTAQAKTTYLHLSDEINDESVTPLLDGLENAPHDKGDAVVIEINSPGGEVDAGFKLVKAIERFPAKVLCVVDGEADSMASYVFESCDIRAMTRRSIMMIHQPGTGGHGQVTDLLNVVDWLTVTAAGMYEHYALRMHITAAELATRTAGGRELWFDWKAAQKYGAVDIVVDRITDLF